MDNAGEIDLILKELYESYNGQFHPLHKIIFSAKINTQSSRRMKIKAERLKKDGLIEVEILDGTLQVKLTKLGLSFCERSSYAYPDFPIITHKTEQKKLPKKGSHKVEVNGRSFT